LLPFQIKILKKNNILLKSCECCGLNTKQNWYLYKPTKKILCLINTEIGLSLFGKQTNPHTQQVLCEECWTYWKKYSSFKYPKVQIGLLDHIRRNNQNISKLSESSKSGNSDGNSVYLFCLKILNLIQEKKILTIFNLEFSIDLTIEIAKMKTKIDELMKFN
jgi:hypothetical protein